MQLGAASHQPDSCLGLAHWIDSHVALVVPSRCSSPPTCMKPQRVPAMHLPCARCRQSISRFLRLPCRKSAMPSLPFSRLASASSRSLRLPGLPLEPGCSVEVCPDMEQLATHWRKGPLHPSYPLWRLSAFLPPKRYLNSKSMPNSSLACVRTAWGAMGMYRMRHA